MTRDTFHDTGRVSYYSTTKLFDTGFTKIVVVWLDSIVSVKVNSKTFYQILKVLMVMILQEEKHFLIQIEFQIS